MSDWNEDNFLERLMPQLRQQRSAEPDPCPDAETLLAALEGEAPATVRAQVAEHLKQCPACAELQNRLLSFDTEPSPEPEAVWKETRKRLDNWLEGFLRSEEARLRAAKLTATPRKGSRWETFWSPFISWKVVWGLGAVALLVLIADGVIVMEVRRGHPPQVQVAARPAPSQRQPANAQSPEKPAVGAPLVGALAKQRPPVGAPRMGARVNQEHALPQVAEHLPPIPPTPYARNAAAPRAQLPAIAAPGPEAPNLPSQPTQAEAPAQPPPQPAAAQEAPEKTPTSTTLNTELVARPSPLPSSSTASTSGVAAEHLPSVRLEPGAHLLLALSSVKPLPDGSLQFRGTLLLPVAHTGLVALDRGAEVIGVMTTSQGQTSLAVVELVTQSVRYTLKAGTGAMKAQTPGAGGGVHFDRSQVLEMWPTSPSVYERAREITPQPEPPK